MLRSTVLLATLALLLTACSGDDTTTADAPPPAEAPPAEEAPPPPPAEERPEFGATFAEGSNVRFISVKDDGVEVPGTLAVAGGLNMVEEDLSTLTGKLVIDLGSVDTAEEKRDTNIKNLVFGLAADAAGSASVTLTSVTPESAALAPGQSTAADAKLSLDMLGNVSEHDAKLQIARVEDHWIVSTASDIELSMIGIGVGDGAATLKEFCKHAALSDVVKVAAELHVK